MRKDTSFSDAKLTSEEFSKKYWQNGKRPYQYHTAAIEDARDEREQFVFNNIRALRNMQSDLHRNLGNAHMKLFEMKNTLEMTSALTKFNTLVILSVAIQMFVHLLFKRGEERKKFF